jgi:hypothetical protein
MAHVSRDGSGPALSQMLHGATRVKCSPRAGAGMGMGMDGPRTCS